MKQKTVKAYAKINIALNVLNASNGYHNLDTVVTTVNKYDVITVKKRNDSNILVTFTGKYGFIPLNQEETNAYKSAKLFIETFNTLGADIEIIRNIPTGSGMGGSSADIVGVLGALKKLYKVEGKLKPIADSLGSDAGYLLEGGYARLTSRGEVVNKINSQLKLWFVVIYAQNGVNAKDCFSKFDVLNENGVVSDIESVVKGLESEDFTCFNNNIKNALTNSSMSLNEELQVNLGEIKKLYPDYYGMTGSGSTLFILYEHKEMAEWAYLTLKKKYNDNVELLSSYNPEKPYIFDVIFDNLMPKD